MKNVQIVLNSFIYKHECNSNIQAYLVADKISYWILRSDNICMTRNDFEKCEREIRRIVDYYRNLAAMNTVYEFPSHITNRGEVESVTI